MSNRSIWPLDKTLSSAITPVQNGPGRDGNEGTFHIPKISKTGALPLDGLMSYSWWVLPLCRDAVLYSTAPTDCIGNIYDTDASVNAVQKYFALKNLI